MDIGKNIVETVLRGGTSTLKRFIDAGFNLEWMTNQQDFSRAAVFGDWDTAAYLFILREYQKRGEAPSRAFFEHSFPPHALLLSEPEATVDELLEAAKEDRLRAQLEVKGSEFIDLMDAGKYDEAGEVIEEAARQFRSQATEANGVRPMSFAELDDSPVEFLVGNMWVRGSNLLLAAYAKAGKTTLVMHLLKALTGTGEFLGRETREITGTAVYVNLELSQPMLRKYALDAGLELDSKHLLVMDYQGKASQFRVQDSGFQESFARQLRDVDCEVLLIDPLSPILAALGIDGNNAEETRRVLENFSTIGKLAGVSLWISDHTGHADKDRARSSSAKLDWADSLCNLKTLSKDETDPRRKLSITPRGFMPNSLVYSMSEDGELVTGDEAEDAETDEGKLLRLLKGDIGQTVAELMDLACMTKPTLSRKLVALEAKGLARRERQGAKKPDLWYLDDGSE
jgi:hypothetical protein